MFKKVNARERIVGWYHTGPRLKANDMAIHELIQKSMPAGHDATHLFSRWQQREHKRGDEQRGR